MSRRQGDELHHLRKRARTDQSTHECNNLDAWLQWEMGADWKTQKHVRCKLHNTTKLVAAMKFLIKVSPALQSLDLSNNSIGDEGAKALAPAIRESKTLHTVNLSGNRIGDEGAAALAPAIRESKTLRTVNLSGNDIGTEGAKALAPAIRESQTLRTVKLSWNAFGNEGVRALVSAIRESKTLCTVDLSENDIDAAGAKLLDIYHLSIKLTGVLLAKLPPILTSVLKEPWLVAGIVEYVTGGLNCRTKIIT